MKTSSRSTSITSALLLGALLTLGSVAPAAWASGDEASAPTTIPATVEGIWGAIDKETAALAGVIQTGKLEEVHHHAFAIRDLVRALPERSKALTPEQLQKVKANVKFVDALATRLDQSGDANDKAGSVANLGKLQGVLQSIRGYYK